jgi:hypothetical protein
MLLLFYVLCLTVSRRSYLIPVPPGTPRSVYWVSKATGRNGVGVKSQTFFKLFITVACLWGLADGWNPVYLSSKGAAIAMEKDYFAIKHDFMFGPRVREI